MHDQSRKRGLAAIFLAAVFLGFVLSGFCAAHAQTLDGSPEAMEEQYRYALNRGLVSYADEIEVLRAVKDGSLVKVDNKPPYLEIDIDVSFPVALPWVRIWLKRLAHGYHAHCGQPLIVTSLTRPLNRQPHNASPRSVHAAGMAVDLRHSWTIRCHRWLERKLLQQEAAGLIQATWEYDPPHYHVAVYQEEARAR